MNEKSSSPLFPVGGWGGGVGQWLQMTGALTTLPVYPTRCHNGPKRTGTNRNGPMKILKRTSVGTETDFSGYRNGPERISVGTETDWGRLQLIPKRTSVGTRKGRVGYDRSDPNKVMYVLVSRYVGRYVCK